MRDHIIAFVIGGADQIQEDPDWPQRLPIGRPYPKEDDPYAEKKQWQRNYSICRAVAEVLEERYRDHKEYQVPTYNMVWHAWGRYKKKTHAKGSPRSGRSLLPPQGLERVLNPPGINTAGLKQTFLKKSENHFQACAQRDLDDDSQ